MRRPRLVLADDHKLFAEGVRYILKEDYDLVAIVDDGRQLLSTVEKERPDAILIDISMPKLNGIEAVRRLRKAGCKAKLIILTMHADPAFAAAAFDSGADGYVLKHCAEDELQHAVHEVLIGRTYLTPILSENLLQSYKGRAPESNKLAADLTLREREVLQLMAEGKTIKEIGGVLDISPRTVEFHRQNISAKTGIKTIAELTRYAVRHGLVG